MSLTQYKKKRNFSDTPEPEGKEKSSANALRFVIQKHDASHLHYDFRLEMRGVLKSWAVPKGPSLNPADKRLAMMVEDHPYDYRNFEGVIPAGNYGGGTVIIWDEGSFEPIDAEGLSREEQEKLLLKQLHTGNIKFILHGKKVKGYYTLFKLRKGDEKSWLLIKKEDEYVNTDSNIIEKNKSVRTGKTLAQVAAENGTEVNHPGEDLQPEGAKKTPVKKLIKQLPQKAKTAEKKTTVKKSGNYKKKVSDISKLLGDAATLAIEMPLPTEVKPMLATLVDEPFSSDDWLFEIKWDGYRAVAYMDDDYFEMLSRNNLSFVEKYSPVADALKGLGIQALFDGEIVAVDEKGLADFQLLQNWQTTHVGALHYYVFDILWLEGYDLTRLPLIERKRILKELLPTDHPVLKYSDHVIGKGKDFFKVALKGGLEGIMAKKINSKYEVGNRGETWLKIKVNQRQEVIITGFTEPRKTRQYFGALLLGVYKDEELIYIGHTGSGFNKKSLEAIYKKLQPLVIDTPPFPHPPKTNMPATWVKPKLVCEIKFTEWTKDLQARHPIFMGLREDKDPKQITVENSKVMSTIIKGKKAPAKKAVVQKEAGKKKEPTVKKAKVAGTKKKVAPSVLFDIANGKDQEFTINKQELKFTNIDKLYWKKEGITKGDMLNYYAQIAPYILPYMKDRPQSLHRHPNGVGGMHFFQKDIRGKVADWLPKHESFSESTNEMIQYMVCNDEAALLYMANLGCIEMHPWHSRVKKPDNPDYCLIDLDPDKSNTYDEVIQTAHVVKALLDEVKAPCYPKTSGSTGMHIYIPLGAKYNYDQSKQLAELVVNLVNQELPDLTSVERNPDKRKGKIYLDFLQNRESQTVAAPYSLRPKPNAPVSTPLDWSEVKKGLTASTYTIKNIFDRLKRTGDLFEPVLGKGINLESVLKKIEAMVK
jgi:bifunctional non-homologous end joining protein LigD